MPFARCRRLLFVLLIALTAANGFAALGAAEEPVGEPDRKAVEFFEAKIRPVLVKHCYECHSNASKDLRAGLRVDSRAALLEGGDSGPSVVPGDGDKSLLLDALRHGDIKMPPAGKLPDDVIADFKTWIDRGAVDPRIDETPIAKKGVDYAKARELWSLKPVKKPDFPRIPMSPWARGPIDQLVADARDKKGLKPVADAERAELLRRLAFDLTGLPPSAEESSRFLADPSPEAYAQTVDRLLASPRFGERWGRHWLDLARYADSNGRETNIFFQFAWHYRDYVLDAYNADMPFDQFIVEQLAGDLLPADSDEQRDRRRIATAFLAIGPKTFRSAPEQFSMDLIDEQIDVTTRAVLGLTVSCARCHDHKFDAIPTREYYSLAGIFRSTDTLFGPSFVQVAAFDKPYHMYPIGPDAKSLADGAFAYRQQLLKVTNDRMKAASTAYRTQRQIDGMKIEKAAKAKNAAKSDASAQTEASAKTEATATTDAEAKADAELERLLALHKVQLAERERLKAEEAALTAATPPLPDFTQGVRELEKPEDCALRIRGEFDKPGDRVPRGVLSLCTPGETPKIPTDASGRLELARWLVARDNPLAARVAVNRVWRQLFGAGIVASVDNFGQLGERPTHPELLDYLAFQFMESGWSTKRLLREIVLSRVYQLSSRYDADNDRQDAGNAYYWRMTPRRLEVEPLRDAVLAVSGALDLTPPRGPHVGLVRNGLLEENPNVALIANPSNRRTVYLPIVRGHLQEMLATFDFADPNLLNAQRDERTIPAQALYLLNSGWIWEQSRRAAERAIGEAPSDDAGRLDWIYRTFFTRAPSDVERQTMHEFMARRREQARADAAAATPATIKPTSAKPATTAAAAPVASPPDPEAAVWIAVCHALFASAEFRYLR